MKVLMINGSPRPKGNTSIALAEIAKQLEKHGIESEIGSPVYYGQPNGALMAIVQRMLYSELYVITPKLFQFCLTGA